MDTVTETGMAVAMAEVMHFPTVQAYTQGIKSSPDCRKFEHLLIADFACIIANNADSIICTQPDSMSKCLNRSLTSHCASLKSASAVLIEGRCKHSSPSNHAMHARAHLATSQAVTTRQAHALCQSQRSAHLVSLRFSQRSRCFLLSNHWLADHSLYGASSGSNMCQTVFKK